MGRQIERWEIVERYVLLTVGIALVAVNAWAVYLGVGLTRVLVPALLVPCTYWVFWQALYEDRLGSDTLPTLGERLMFWFWVWARRMICGSVSVLCAVAAWHAARGQAPLVGIVCLAMVAFVAGWVALFGGGKHQSMADDRSIQSLRMRRFRRTPFGPSPKLGASKRAGTKSESGCP